MENFSLHPRLSADCHVLGKLSLCQLLLLNNSHYKWLILVPEAEEEQLHELSASQRTTLQAEAQIVSERLQDLYNPERINVGALGNLVPQLHYHVVARTQDDPAWPGPVWGHPDTKPYSETEVAEIKDQFSSLLPLQQ